MNETTLETLGRACLAEPDNAHAYWRLGNALRTLGKTAEALAHYDRALTLQPDFVEAQYNRALTLHAMQRLDEALQGYAHTLILQPAHVDALCNRGAALLTLGQADPAQNCWQTALQIDPAHAPSLYNLGHVLHNRGLSEQALVYYDRALRSRPDYVEALCSYGRALQALNRITEARACYQRALQLQPDLPIAHWNLALCELLQGDYARGWLEYEWGWAAGERGLPREVGSIPASTLTPTSPTSTTANASASLWRGATPLAGKRILLYAEQGLGDTLQFCRYAPLVAALGAQVWLEVQTPLVALLAQLPGLVGVHAQGEAPPDTDFHCPLLSLPLALRTRLDTIPAQPAYLRAAPAPSGAWAARLAHLPRPRVGLAWSGNPHHKLDAQRSLPLATLLPALAGDCTLVRIQTDIRPGDAALLEQYGVFDASDALRDFSDTAALLANLDHVISVDTSVAHLAGAMGIPTTLLLPYAPDFRWLLERDDSPWYPSLRLLRQAAPGDWSSVIARLPNRQPPHSDE